MKEIASTGIFRVDHRDIISLLPEFPGKDMIAAMCKSLWTRQGKYMGPPELRFAIHPEFRLGPCGNEGKPGRIDTIVEIRTPDMLQDGIHGITLGLEIKTTGKDLLDAEDNMFSKYINSGHCDYYWLVAADDTLALMACIKYNQVPQIGVISFASARVLKTPQRAKKTHKGLLHYTQELESRSASIDYNPLHKYHIQDNRWTPLSIY